MFTPLLKNKKWLITTASVLLISVGIFMLSYEKGIDTSALPETLDLSEESLTPINDGGVLAESKPVHIRAESIDLDADIIELGLTENQEIEVPKKYDIVGWYKYGVMPGEIGSAVIAGHVNDGFALPGVFVNLKDLKNGDDIYVTTNNNTRLHFVMTSRKIYNYDAPTEEIFEDNSGKLLKLITCTGNWLTELGTHEQRIVVTAVLAS